MAPLANNDDDDEEDDGNDGNDVNDGNDEGGCGDGRGGGGGGCGQDGGGPDLINTNFSIKGTRVRMLMDDFKEEWFAFTIVDGRYPDPPGKPCK